MTDEFLSFPARFREAKPSDGFTPVIREACGPYVRNWPENQKAGFGLTLMGDSGAGKSRAAAALARSIVAHYYPNYGFDAFWLSVASDLQDLLELRRMGSESYYARYRRMFNADLLIVDDLLQVAEYAQQKEYLFAVFSHRYDHLKPTITTINTLDLKDVERAFNAGFLRRLEHTSLMLTVAKEHE